MVIAPLGKKVGKREFPIFPEISTHKRPVVGRPTPSKSFPLRQHRHRTSLFYHLQISQHISTGFSSLDQSPSRHWFYIFNPLSAVGAYRCLAKAIGVD